MSSDYGDMCREMKEFKKARRAKWGVECPQCKLQRPKTNASILLPGQQCKVDGYRDQRPKSIMHGDKHE